MNIAKMMKQAQQMQKKMQDAQEALAEKQIESRVGGGKVTVTATGAGDIVGIKIDPAAVDPDDVEFLEDLVLQGVKQAQEDAKVLAQEEMAKVGGGLDLGGLGMGM